MADDEKTRSTNPLPEVVFDPIESHDDAPQVPANEPEAPRLDAPAKTPGPFGRQNPDPGALFRTVFTSELKREILAAAMRAYRIVQEDQRPNVGYNSQTFGHCVYHVGCYQLGEVCKLSPGQLTRMEELGNLARFQSGDYTLGFYKVGKSAHENIWECFPTSENGANDGHPILPGLEDELLDQVDALRYVVVAHLGNPEDGLCALYLCIPIEKSGGKIRRWGYAEPIYIADGTMAVSVEAPDAPLTPEAPRISVPAEEPEGDVVVSPKEIDSTVVLGPQED